MRTLKPNLSSSVWFIIWAAMIGVLGLNPNVAQAQSLLLIWNGSFESPGIRGITQTVPNYWTVNSGTVSIVNTTSANYAQYLPAADGSQVLVLYASSISQNVSLVSGQEYQLTFDLSPRQYDGSSPQDAYLNLAISDGSQSLNQPFFVPAGSTNWTQESFLFVADDSSQYALSLASPPLQQYMSVIDNVNMEAVPEPSIAVLLSGGILVVHLLKRKIRLKQLR
jgi:hypothetical protein